VLMNQYADDTIAYSTIAMGVPININR